MTTRQAHQDGQRLFELLSSGLTLQPDSELRDGDLRSAIGELVTLGKAWLAQQHIHVACDRAAGPAVWIETILQQAKGRSGGRLEQHLVGAKLEERFDRDDIAVPNFAGHAADRQTSRSGDFAVGRAVFHVTLAPGEAVVEKCRQNVAMGLHAVLLVPRELVQKTRGMAELKQVDQRITVLGIEDFLAMNIVEMAISLRGEFFDVMQRIVNRYNVRLEAVETDMSLKIDIT